MIKHIVGLSLLMPSVVTGFAVQRQGPPPISSHLQAEQQPTTAGFEYQEMRAILEAMETQNVPSRYLQPDKRAEIAGYARTVALCESPISLEDIEEELPGTNWRLGFSTETAVLGDLPSDADVLMKFHDRTNLDYCLEFTEKTFGLERIVAKSKYSVKNNGRVQFTYEEIVTDLLGWKNLAVGFFGLLKGRVNYVESVYMDNKFWIERGVTSKGAEYLNVYMKQPDSIDDDDLWNY